MLHWKNWLQQTAIIFNLFKAYISSVESLCTVDSTLSYFRLPYYSGNTWATSIYWVSPSWGSRWVTRCLADPELRTEALLENKKVFFCDSRCWQYPNIQYSLYKTLWSWMSYYCPQNLQFSATISEIWPFLAILWFFAHTKKAQCWFLMHYITYRSCAYFKKKESTWMPLGFQLKM
jgi:hypothetical protein